MGRIEMAGAKRGLGRGLGALFGEDTVEEVILWDENIEIEKIDYLSEYNKNRDNLHNNKGNN